MTNPGQPNAALDCTRNINSRRKDRQRCPARISTVQQSQHTLPRKKTELERRPIGGEAARGLHTLLILFPSPLFFAAATSPVWLHAHPSLYVRGIGQTETHTDREERWVDLRGGGSKTDVLSLAGGGRSSFPRPPWESEKEPTKRQHGMGGWCHATSLPPGGGGGGGVLRGSLL